ncbi:uncharacterized protein LOC120112262 [Phoenix dactylifera]|uniref:Uncharacterized protein LOC120112262 n=1 Tax=Phoenix dactylifera TaxID=42345 RepID=A0A8B9AN54_PHODC|nr:uncharacterized protein LOC120112262 [Phoenix dactylifera]
MIELIKCLNTLRFLLHDQLGKDAIFSLRESYRPFLTHYRMTKPAVNYHRLLGLLQTFEKDHQLQKESMHVVGGSSEGRRPFKKGKKKKNKNNKAKTSKQSQTKKKADQSQAKYFYYKKQEHWKRNYPQYIASLDPNRPSKRKELSVADQGSSGQ